ncbi:MAG TPA: FtsQ-type POTRA domain-containing protein, partial [Ktedonobacteraceae bacterium]|nr:FtsQ-type POTRA domain-containing protein [Ktedonobacteraceae bacterium]
MIEKKQPKEQIAFEYRDRVSSRPANGLASPGGRARSEGRSPVHANPTARKRVVRTPEEIVQPTPWAERQAHMRRAHAEPHAKNRIVKRTLAQTGMPASEGLVRPVRPLLRQPLPAQVPVRSGRRHASRGRFWRRFLSVFALLVICTVGASFALTSSNFRVLQVNVEGTQNRILVHSIQNMGIQGQNIFLLDVGALSTRIEALPSVASVNLEKLLPDQLVVSIAERTPVLLWQTRQGTFSSDSSGVVIAPASESSNTDHLMTVVDVRGAAAQQVQPGFHLNAADVAFAMQVFARLPQLAGVSPFTLRYDVVPRQGGDASFIVAGPAGWLAYLGSANDSNPLDNRLLELQQIL